MKLCKVGVVRTLHCLAETAGRSLLLRHRTPSRSW